jgi:hypothetical protein
MMDATQRVKEIGAGYRAKVERLRADPDYSQEYKQQRLAAAYLAAREEMAQVKAGHEHAVRSDRVRAEKALFGLGNQASGSETIAFRDAADRAGQLQEPTEAITALRRATTSGDGQLAAAIARHARTRGWAEVAGAWAEDAGPAARRHLDDLAEADSTAAFWDSGYGRLMTSGIFRIEPPSELAGLDDAQIEQAATQRAG